MGTIEKRPHITRRPEGLTPHELEANQEYYDRLIRELSGSITALTNQINTLAGQVNDHESRITALE